ncbi:uncharacterized protein Z520_05867 [Fonsecaea multimorphosa CBS 102226]|uniref:Methyltransferase type 11 domain-containing protein n=1 Tax=Fonsecaea multimorphosa CBS 102226 TaxID=1442371 RepID=A0A0D2ING2_9EURO|nr:uncharacterized protein Z520_05867 [Fonsecaea multimorphosa CBS 102226]KIX98566.1 hypothetical protein Z520_05867 [Fonsecaea multimorphosa CBS 102226]OAL24757.1 hypothetical protein AYO22_05546 [Fonsecaea multimorphosa]
MANTNPNEFNPSGHFDKLSSSYDDLIGLMTGDIGRYTLQALIEPPNSDMVIHDNACGTGLVTEYLQQVSSTTGTYPKMIYATDFVPSVTRIMQQKAARQQWRNIDISVMDSQELTFPDALFDLSITNFGIFFLPDPQRGADQIYRTLKPGGLAVVTAWKERRMMDTIVVAQKTIRPDLKTLYSPWAELWSKEETLRNVLVNAGFKAENIKIVEKRTDSLAEPFLRDPEMVARSYPAAVEGWSEQDKAKLGQEILRLARERDPEGGGVGGIYSVAYIAIATK